MKQCKVKGVVCRVEDERCKGGCFFGQGLICLLVSGICFLAFWIDAVWYKKNSQGRPNEP